MPPVKTDTSHAPEKLEVRRAALARVDADPVRVLDAYAGHGTIWRTLRAESDRRIVVTSVDQRPDAPPGTIRADNRKILAAMSADAFDLVDLDAYGIPCEQLALVARATGCAVPVVVTAIKANLGPIPNAMLRAAGVPVEWGRTVPSLPPRLGFARLWDGYCHALGYRHRAGYTIADSGMTKRYDLLST